MKAKHIKKLALAASLVAFAPNAFAQDATDTKVEVKVEAAPDTKVTTEVMAIEPGSLTTSIADSVTFSTLSLALKASGLDMELGQKGSFTIFAPTDEAFQKLPGGTLDKLLLPENKEKLRSLLLFHVVPGVVMSADLKDMEVKTLNGEKLEVDVDDAGKEIEINEVKVFSTDVTATNGVMHSVGEVLVPKSLDGFAGLDE